MVYEIKSKFYEDLSIDMDYTKIIYQTNHKMHINGFPISRHGLILGQDGATTYIMLFIVIFLLYIALFRRF